MKPRRLLLAFTLLAVVAAALYLLFPFLRPPRVVTLGSVASSDLLALAPASEQLLIVPNAASLYFSLRRDELTAHAMEQLDRKQPSRQFAWLLGNATLLAWRAENGDYELAALPDPFRLALLRIYAGMTGAFEVRDGVVLRAGTRTGGGDWSAAVNRFAKLEGEAFLLNSNKASVPKIFRGESGAFAFDRREKKLSVRGTVLRPEPSRIAPEVPQPPGAILTLSFAEPPRFLGELSEFGIDLGPLFTHGGLFVLYEIDDRKLIPRPRFVVAVPKGSGNVLTLLDKLPDGDHPLSKLLGVVPKSEQREVAASTVSRISTPVYTLEYAIRGDFLILGFDDSSVSRFLSEPPGQPVKGASLAMRLRPQELEASLSKFVDNPAGKLLRISGRKEAKQLLGLLTMFPEASEVTLRMNPVAGGEDVLIVIR